MLGVGGTGVDHVLLVVVGDDHAVGVQLVEAVLVGGDRGHVHVTEGAAFVQEVVHAAETAHGQAVAVTHRAAHGIAELQVHDLVLVPGPGEVGAVVPLAAAVVEAESHFDTGVVHAAAVQVHVRAEGGGGDTGIVELVEGLRVVVGRVDLQLAVEEMDVRTEFPGLRALGDEFGVAAAGAGGDVAAHLLVAGIQQEQGRIRRVTHFRVGAADLPVREEGALQERKEFGHDAGKADGRIGDAAGRVQRGVPVHAVGHVQIDLAAITQLGVREHGLVLVAVTAGGKQRVGVVLVDVAQVELVVDGLERTGSVVRPEGDVVDVGAHHTGEIHHIVTEILVEGGEDLAELLLGVLVHAAVEAVLGTFGEEGVRGGVELALLDLVGAVVLGAGAQGQPLEGLVGELAGTHHAVLLVLPLLVLGDPVGILHRVLEVVGPVLRLDVAAGVIALVHAHLGEVVSRREQVHRDDRVAVFALGDHVLLVHAAVGHVDVHREDVLHEVGGVAEGEVVAVHVVVVDDATGVRDGGGDVGLAAVGTRREGDGVHLVHARLEEVARVVGGRGVQLRAPAVVGAGGGRAVRVLELRHHIGAGEGRGVRVVDVQPVLAALLGGDDDDAVRRVGTVQGRRGRAGEDGDRLDVVLVQGTEHVTGLAGAGIDAFRLGSAQGLHRDTVDHIQRIVVVGDGLGTAHHDTGCAARARGGLADGYARHLAVQAVDEGTHRTHRLHFGLLDIVGEGFFLLADTHGGDHRRVERDVVRRQGDIDDRTASDLLDGVFLADVGEAEGLRRSRDGDRVATVQVGDGTYRGISLHDDTGADERFSEVIGDGTRDGPVLGQGESACDEQPRQGRKGPCQDFL